MKRIIQAISLLGWFILLLAIAYPLLLTVFALMTWSDSAKGSLLVREGKVRGSVYVGQSFTSDKYFWPRPSASDYATLPSRSPQFVLGSAQLAERVEKSKRFLMEKHRIQNPALIPSGLLFASASGIDPDIMLPSAFFQIERVAKARGIDTEEGKKKLRDLIIQAKVKKPLNLFGRDCINVLLLNESLDKEKP